MVDQFVPVRGSQSFLYFSEKPFVIIDEPLDRLLHECLCVAAALSGEAIELGL
jgi:hypothetical protein